MPSVDILRSLALKKNPYTDRTGEKTDLDERAVYIPSDLQNFQCTDQTYVFFGRRGAGKTTIRLMMERTYRLHNEEAARSGKTKGYFMIDLTRPAHLTACLAAYMRRMGYGKESWDAQFSSGSWTSADFADSVIRSALEDLVVRASAPGPESESLLAALRADPRLSRQFLVLAHVYATSDSRALGGLRRRLLPSPVVAYAVTGASALLAGAACLSLGPSALEAAGRALGVEPEAVHEAVPDIVRSHPRIFGLVGAALGATAATSLMHLAKQRSLRRAREVFRTVRVVDPPSSFGPLAEVLDSLFSTQDSVEAIRLLVLGTAAYDKLALLASLVRGLGYEGMSTFGDCFDEVSLLDPVLYPGALKAFAREVCRNEVLNAGRLHLFFPDSRVALDLSTDRVLKEARFDRHFVRDLVWSRHQLEELADRRFRAAQLESGLADGAKTLPSFHDMFKRVKVEDFSSFIAKLATPRELMIFMTELLMRAEASPEGALTAQDLEIAVSKALEQAV